MNKSAVPKGVRICSSEGENLEEAILHSTIDCRTIMDPLSDNNSTSSIPTQTKPSDSSSQSILLESLTRWDKSLERSDHQTNNNPDSHLNGSNPGKDSIFPFRPDINSQICLWKGDLCTLQVDCIVNPTNEQLKDVDDVSARISRYVC